MPTKRRTCGGKGTKTGASKSRWIKAIKKLASEYQKDPRNKVYKRPSIGMGHVISKTRPVKKNK